MNNNNLPDFRDTDLEKSVIGALLKDGAYAFDEVRDELTADLFFDPLMQGCFKALKECFSEGIDFVDTSIFTVKAQQINQFEWPKEHDVIAWKNKDIKTSNLDYMVKGLIELKAKRDITDHVSRAIDYINANKYLTSNDLQKGIKSILTDKIEVQNNYMQDAFVTLVNYVEKLQQGKIDPVLSTGFSSIDSLLENNGLKYGSLNIIGARPGIGKSAIMNNIILNMLLSDTDKVLKPMIMFSLEMSKEEIIKRFMSSMANIPSSKIGRCPPIINADEWDRILKISKDAFDHKDRAPRLILVDKGGLTLDDIKSYIDEVIAKYGGISVVCLDYLQLMSVDTTNKTTATALGDISGYLKALALRQKCIVISAVQLNRTADDIKQELRASMIKDSGNIEQDADFIVLLRKNIIDGREINTEREVSVVKNRSGSTGSFILDFKGESYNFCEKEHPYDYGDYIPPELKDIEPDFDQDIMND